MSINMSNYTFSVMAWLWPGIGLESCNLAGNVCAMENEGQVFKGDMFVAWRQVSILFCIRSAVT